MPINTKDPIEAKNYKFGKDLFKDITFVSKYFGMPEKNVIKQHIIRKLTDISWTLRTKQWGLTWFDYEPVELTAYSMHTSTYASEFEDFLKKIVLNAKRS